MTRKPLPGSYQHREVKPQQQQLVTLRETYNKQKGELKKRPTEIKENWITIAFDKLQLKYCKNLLV